MGTSTCCCSDLHKDFFGFQMRRNSALFWVSLKKGQFWNLTVELIISDCVPRMPKYTWYECSYPGRKNQYYCNVKLGSACSEKPDEGPESGSVKSLDIDCDLSGTFCFYISLSCDAQLLL